MDWCLLLTFIHTYLRNLLIVLLYYRYTCDYLYYTTIFVIMLPTTHRHCKPLHRDTSDTSLLYSSSFGVFSVIRFPHYFIKKMIKQWHLHKIFYFCTPIQPKIIIGSTCLPPSNRKPNNDLFWFPPFGMKSYYTHFRFHCCIFANNLTQKVNPKPYYEKENSWAFCFGTTCLFPITLLPLLWCL